MVSEGTGVAERKKVGVVTIISLEKARAPHLPTEKKGAIGPPRLLFRLGTVEVRIELIAHCEKRGK